MDKREPLLSIAYFDTAIKRQERMITETEEDLRLPGDEILLDVAYLVLFQARYAVLILEYSRGQPLTQLGERLLSTLEALEGCRNHPEPQAGDLFFNGQQDEYMQALTLVSLALLLHVETPVFQRLVAAIGASGQDYLLEWLIGRRLPQRPATTRLLFPNTYARLRDAIQAPRDIQSPVLQQFLSAWYESLDTVWYNIHAHRQDSAGFTGYWCWEAAAVAYGLRADDTALRPMPYYPTDLADYALGRRPQPE